MSVYEELMDGGRIPKGDHLARIDAVDLKVSKAKGNEYLQLRLKLKSGDAIWHNLNFTEGTIPMTVKQLKNLSLIESLPIYASVSDLIKDKDNFIRKTMNLLTALEGKKITIKVTGHDESDRPKTWIQSFDDIPNAAIQTESKKTSTKPSSFNEKEELPF